MKRVATHTIADIDFSPPWVLCSCGWTVDEPREDGLAEAFRIHRTTAGAGRADTHPRGGGATSPAFTIKAKRRAATGAIPCMGAARPQEDTP